MLNGKSLYDVLAIGDVMKLDEFSNFLSLM